MSRWKVVLLKPAERYLDSISKNERQRVINALKILQDNPEASLYKKLKGRSEWSLRVGRKRILFRLDRGKKYFVITQIGPRGDIYRS